MTNDEKITLLERLQKEGVLSELPPMDNGHGGVAWWRYKVLVPTKLPDSLKYEYQKHGELRW